MPGFLFHKPIEGAIDRPLLPLPDLAAVAFVGLFTPRRFSVLSQNRTSRYSWPARRPSGLLPSSSPEAHSHIDSSARSQVSICTGLTVNE